jgi:hypothetical protein
MAYTFTDATLLGYQVNKNYLGEGLFSINTTKDLTIEGIFLNPNQLEGVNESFQKITGLLTGIVNTYDSVIINGYNLGSGKILNISFPEQNPIRLGRYIYNIQILENSQFTNIQTGDIYGTYLSTVNDKINSLEENINFDNAENGDYSYNHDINIEYYDEGSDLFTKSKDFASSVYNDNLNLGLIGPFSGFYNILKTKKNYFSETYDLINKRCSFSKRILINKNYNSNYTTSLTHNLTLDGNGKVTVTENGRIKALDNTLAYTADDYFDTELSNSYTRCQDIFNTYTEKYGLGQKDSLYNQPFNLGKTSNEFENSLEYSVNYVNDPAFEGNIINNYNITVSQDLQGVINYSEQGDLVEVGQIGGITDLDLIKAKYLNAKTRALTNYPNLKLRSSSFNNSILVDEAPLNFSLYQTGTVSPTSSLTGIYVPKNSTIILKISGNYGGRPISFVKGRTAPSSLAEAPLTLYKVDYYSGVPAGPYSVFPQTIPYTGRSFTPSSTFLTADQYINPSLNPRGVYSGNVGDFNYISFITVPIGGGNPLLELNVKRDAIYNNQFSYSLDKTSDTSILEGNPYYKSFSMNIEDQEPYDLYKEYIIANRNPKNIFFVSGNQVEIGNKSVTINGNLVKPTGNFWSAPIDFPLEDLKAKSVYGAFNLISNEAYIDNINYSYDSENSFSFNLNVKYLKKVDGT